MMNMNIDCEEEINVQEDVELSLEELGVDNGVSGVDNGVSGIDELGGVSSTNQCKVIELNCGVNEVTGTSVAIEPPRVGMVFESWELIEGYYRRYGLQEGFGVCRVAGSYRTGKGSENVKRSATWRCECHGKPDMRARREAKKKAKAMGVAGNVEVEVEPRSKRKSKKCDCTAMIYAGLNMENKWELRKVVLEHLNHDPKLMKSQLVKKYGMEGYTTTRKRKLSSDYDDNPGLPVPQTNGSSVVKIDDIENMERIQKTDRRPRRVADDANAMMDFFEKMQRDNHNFFYVHRSDGFGVVQDIFWVDARSRAAYEEFGDVVCFDKTYLTKGYELPLVNFVGVNHHGQPVLLGCAIVSQDDSATFAWVFQQWLLCMGGRAPNLILTDDAAALRKAIAEVIPSTCHRWCVWYLLQKLPKMLGMFPRFQEMEDELKEVIYGSYTIDEFERQWVPVVNKYALGDNDWLCDLYEERAMWVPAFMKDMFWAGIKITQREENVNNYFDYFVTRQTRLFEFVEKYCATMEKRVSDEKDEDVKSLKHVRKLATGFKAEKIFREVYTDNKFKEVQRECERVIYCYGSREIVGDTVVHHMDDRVWVSSKGSSEEEITDTRRVYQVCYKPRLKEVDCECKLFETQGILCRHCIRVLDFHLFGEVPEKYILRRWRKDVPRKYAQVKVAYKDFIKTVESERYDKMMVAFEPLCDSASNAEETTTIVVNGLKDIQFSVNEWLSKKSASSVDDNDVNEVHTVINGFVEKNV